MTATTLLKGSSALLIVAFLSVSILTLVPVQDADAWNAHACNCRSEIVYNSDGSWYVKFTCDWYFHWYPFKHDWECPEDD